MLRNRIVLSTIGIILEIINYSYQSLFSYSILKYLNITKKFCYTGLLCYRMLSIVGVSNSIIRELFRVPVPKNMNTTLVFK